MKPSIFESASQKTESTHSFVVRIWLEKPGQLRGTIQHVQSETRRGFERLAQVQQFIEKYLPSPVTKSSASSVSGWLPKRGFRIVAAIGALVVLLVSVTLFGNSYSGVYATGASTSLPSLASILIFLAGAALGGSAIAVVHRLK